MKNDLRPLALGGKSEKRSPLACPPAQAVAPLLKHAATGAFGAGADVTRRVSGCGSTGTGSKASPPSPLFLKAWPQATFPGPRTCLEITWHSPGKPADTQSGGGRAGEGRAGRDGPHPERNLRGASITATCYFPTAARWQDEALTQMRAGPGRKIAESQDCPPPRPVRCVSTPKTLTLHPTSLLLPTSGSC